MKLPAAKKQGNKDEIEKGQGWCYKAVDRNVEFRYNKSKRNNFVIFETDLTYFRQNKDSFTWRYPSAVLF